MKKTEIIIPNYEHLPERTINRTIGLTAELCPDMVTFPETDCDLTAVFYEADTKENPCKVDPNSWVVVRPGKTIEDNGYAKLYDDILDRMEMVREYASDTYNPGWPDETRNKADRDFWKQQLSPENKEKFIKGYIGKSINFEKVRPQVKAFVEKYMTENPNFKYAYVISVPQKI